MRIAVFYGGMRIGRNTDKVLGKALDGMVRGFTRNGYSIERLDPADFRQSKEKELHIVRYDLKKMKISACTSCMGCTKDGDCIVRDEMHTIYKEFDEADMVVFASPIYFNSITAVMKSMIDRCQIYWARRFALNVPKTKKRKKGILILTAGSELKDVEAQGSRQIFDILFKAIDTDYTKETIVRGTDRRDLAERGEELEILSDEYEAFVQDVLDSMGN